VGAGRYNCRHHTPQGRPRRPCTTSIPQHEESSCSHPSIRWADFGLHEWTAQATRGASAPVSLFFAFSGPDPRPIQVLRFPFNPEFRPFNVYSLLTSLLGCYRSSWLAGSRPSLRRHPSPLCRSSLQTFSVLLLLRNDRISHLPAEAGAFVFITLRIPPRVPRPKSIFIPFIFITLRIAFPASLLF
jgi:hypothetical protein